MRNVLVLFENNFSVTLRVDLYSCRNRQRLDRNVSISIADVLLVNQDEILTTTYSILSKLSVCNFFCVALQQYLPFIPGSPVGDQLSWSHLLQSCVLKGDFQAENSIKVRESNCCLTHGENFSNLFSLFFCSKNNTLYMLRPREVKASLSIYIMTLTFKKL